jgi:hypothetical protein
MSFFKIANSRIGLATFAIVVFIAMLCVTPAHPKFDSRPGRLFMAFWTAGCLSLTAIFFFSLRTARMILDAVDVFNWSSRDPYAMSDLQIRAFGVFELVIALSGVASYIGG